MKAFLQYHLVPLCLAVIIAIGLINISSPLRDQAQLPAIKIKGEAKKQSGLYANLESGVQAEIDFMGSLQDKEQLTLFGSSEFSDSPFVPYNFLADSFGVKIMGLGHAYHQHLGILIELLSASEYLEGANVSIILSHHWFKKGKGTNTQAFLEFARPNFLNKIANDSQIPPQYKKHIGAYIHRNEADFSFLSPSMKALRNSYLKNEGWSLAKFKADLELKIMNEPSLPEVNYQVENSSTSSSNNKPLAWEKLLSKEQSAFKQSVTNNNFWVDDTYFEQYVKQKNGELKSVSVKSINADQSEEFADFLMLLNLVKERKINCSFIIQPLNPYYYKQLDNYNDLTNRIIQELEAKQIPYLNLFESEKENYEPGTLKDVMHLGDYGWLKVNRFLYQQYFEN